MAAIPVPSQLLGVPPIWREGRTALELAELLRDPVFRDVDPATGGERPVLLVPGFLAGDGSLGLMTRWLRGAGHRAHRTGIRLNVDCSARALEVMERRVEKLAERYGRRVTVIGQSRGGTLGRALAATRPDLVDVLVALGSPQLDPLAVHPLVKLQVGMLGVLGTLGAPGLFRDSCLHGGCCREYRASFGAPFPDDVRYVSIYSRSDGIVDWRACLDPAAELVEVDASHIGMAMNVAVYRAVAEALAPRDSAELPLAA
jgi:pimeloyl-ACP methyl ester carboxylesterase